MKTISLSCAECQTEFTKPLKEYTRQKKRNPSHRFYCSSRCCGKQNVAHLFDISLFKSGDALHRKAIEAARITNTKYTEEEKPFYHLLRRCQKRKHECTLTIADLRMIWDRQLGRCAVTNIPLELDANDFVNMASVDRIDNTRGYLPDNVQFVSCCVNYAKSSMNDERIHAFFRLVCEHYIDPNRRTD